MRRHIDGRGVGADGYAARDEGLYAQASEVARMLPALMRRLFALDHEHPVADMPLAQVRLMGALEAGPRAMSALGEELGISVSAVTQMADRLERAGLVERVPDREDRRVRHLRLTGAGEGVLRSRQQRRALAAMQALEGMLPSERAEVLCALRLLLGACQQPAGHASMPAEAHVEVAVR